MKNFRYQIINNILLLISFIVSAGSGVFMWFVFPSGEKTGRKVVMGLSKHDWGDIHAYVSFLMIALIIIHLIQYWPFFKNMKRLWKAKQ